MRELNVLYEIQNEKTPLELYFDSLVAPRLNTLISENDIMEVFKIIKDPRLSCQFLKKQKMVADILKRNGFIKLAAGTNRNVYINYDVPEIVMKVAMDENCLSDNLDEFNNQFLFKPFVTKVFEVHPTGVIGIFEKVNPIKSREEFISIAEDVYNLLIHFTGKYVLNDVGTETFMNYGFRPGFGPVLLDFPYVYELDGDKLECKRTLSDGSICCGDIDYDAGFNHLVCSKCGTKYSAVELRKKIKNKEIVVNKPKGELNMVIEFMIGNEVIDTVDTRGEYSTYKKNYNKKQNKSYNNNRKFTIEFIDPSSNKEEEIESNENYQYKQEDSVESSLSYNQNRSIEYEEVETEDNTEYKEIEKIESNEINNIEVVEVEDDEYEFTDSTQQELTVNLPEEQEYDLVYSDSDEKNNISNSLQDLMKNMNINDDTTSNININEKTSEQRIAQEYKRTHKPKSKSLDFDMEGF